MASGGVDSTACIRYYLERSFTVKALFIDYGQLALLSESIAVDKICNYYGVPLQTYKVADLNWTVRNSDELIGRNLLFASVALVNYPESNGLIAMGIHSGTDYFDCSSEFQHKLSELSLIVSGGKIDFDFPFGLWSKGDIVAYCRNNDIPIHLTYSCVMSNTPCGRCLSCQDRSSYNLDGSDNG